MAHWVHFHRKLKWHFFLGKMSISIRNELHLLRKIRNEFGHSPDFIDFNTSNIKDRCKALQGSWKNEKSTPRQHFTASVSSVLAVLHAETYSTKNPVNMIFEFPFIENKEWYEEKVNNLAELLRKENS